MNNRMTELQEQKNTYREQARLHRARMEVDSADFEHVIETFFSNFDFTTDKVISAYWPVGREFDVRFLLDELVQRGFKVALPVIEKDSLILKFREWRPDVEMKAGAYDVMEPVGTETLEPDVILAPLLAFDRKGNRMGQGGGYFDATLEHYRAKGSVTYIGVAFAQQAVLFSLPTEKHDQKLDFMLTQHEVTKF